MFLINPNCRKFYKYCKTHEIMEKIPLTKENLIFYYFEKQMSLRQLVKAMGWSDKTIMKKFKEFNLEFRSKKESTKLACDTGYRKKLYGKDNPSYKGGYIRKDGYKLISIKGKQILEHQHVWIQNNGPIPKGYQIHHKDGDRLNNKIDNLECMRNSEHQKLHNQPRDSQTKRYIKR